MENGISKAVRLAGSQTALAHVVGVTPQAVQKWVEQGFVPGNRCRLIEDRFQSEVTRCELNPELFGSTEKAVDSADASAKSI